MVEGPDTDDSPLEEIAHRLGLDDCDLVLAGDGSGLGWDDACGWATILLDVETGGRRAFKGGMDSGTSFLAEIVPYMQALSWYEARHGEAKRRKLGRPIRVGIITDAKNLAEGVGGQAASAPNRPWWAALTAFENLGYELEFVWMKRLGARANCYADDVARRCRRAISAAAVIDDIEEPLDRKGRKVRHTDVNSGPYRGSTKDRLAS